MINHVAMFNFVQQFLSHQFIYTSKGFIEQNELKM